MSAKWLKTFEEIGMLWRHDGNPKRPYARLTSGKISNGFVNCSHLISRPQMLHEALKELVGQYKLPEKPFVVVGQAMGNITIASHLALIMGGRSCWSIKINDEAMNIDPRFSLSTDVPAILGEDVTTTGGTSRKTKVALESLKVPLAPYLYTVVNRSGQKTVEGLEIRALVTLDIATWDWGNNPFTETGAELVEPVKPKGNWEALRREYA